MLAGIRGRVPLERIPDTALILVRLKSPEATIKKVADFAGRINDDYKPLVTRAAGLLGNVISNPAQAGVDRKRDWWLVVVGKPGHPAEVVFGLPAAEENTMKRARQRLPVRLVQGLCLLYAERARPRRVRSPPGRSSEVGRVGARSAIARPVRQLRLGGLCQRSRAAPGLPEHDRRVEAEGRQLRQTIRRRQPGRAEPRSRQGSDRQTLCRHDQRTVPGARGRRAIRLRDQSPRQGSRRRGT